jgi:hypothetical protein
VAAFLRDDDYRYYCGLDGAEAHERSEATVGAGNYSLATNKSCVPHDTLSNKLWMLEGVRDRRRCTTTLQGKVAPADQMAHDAVADPNRRSPMPSATGVPATAWRPPP